jgi:hypothetical protein
MLCVNRPVRGVVLADSARRGYAETGVRGRSPAASNSIRSLAAYSPTLRTLSNVPQENIIVQSNAAVLP